DGSYTYHLDNDNPEVNALGADDTLIDEFIYTLSDPDGLSDTATLTITIDGNNDGAPTAVPDDANGPDTDGDATVHESGLRDAPPDGETATGTIKLSAPDNLGSLAIAGTLVSGAGVQTGGNVVITLAQLQALDAD